MKGNKQNMKNILSYQDAKFSGKEIKDWIKYHTENQTSHTHIAKDMRKYLNIDDNTMYKLVKGTYESSASYNKYLVEKAAIYDSRSANGL